MIYFLTLYFIFLWTFHGCFMPLPFCLDYCSFGSFEVTYYDHMICFLCFSPKTALDMLILFHCHVQFRIVYMCVCVYMYICVCIYVCVYVYVYIYVYIYNWWDYDRNYTECIEQFGENWHLKNIVSQSILYLFRSPLICFSNAL